MATAAPTVREFTAPDEDIVRVRTLVRALDKYYLDPILGFILPGVGDVLGSVLGLYPVAIAVKRGLSMVIVARMLLNLALDALFGAVPLLGDLVDAGFRANTKNLDLLESRSVQGGRATGKDYAMVAGAAIVFVLAVLAAIFVIRAVFRAIAGA